MNDSSDDLQDVHEFSMETDLDGPTPPRAVPTARQHADLTPPIMETPPPISSPKYSNRSAEKEYSSPRFSNPTMERRKSAKDIQEKTPTKMDVQKVNKSRDEPMETKRTLSTPPPKISSSTVSANHKVAAHSTPPVAKAKNSLQTTPSVTNISSTGKKLSPSTVLISPAAKRQSVSAAIAASNGSPSGLKTTTKIAIRS